MKKILLAILIILFSLSAQALFEVKDASDHSVLKVSDDGLMIFNYPDTLMIISSSEIRANLDNSTGKGLSRSFSVSTNTTSKEGLANVLEVTTDNTIMREGGQGNRYTDFSPLNLFLGLDAGQNTIPNPLPFSVGNQTTWEGKFNIFVGNEAGRDNVDGYFNLFIGDKSGQSNTDGQKNTFVGSQSGQANVAGGYNSHFGYNSGITSTGYYNTFMGANCGFNNGATHYNTYIGCASGEYFQGSNNTFLGYATGRNASTVRSGSGNVFIGSNVGTASGSVSNKLYIDNSNTNSPLIYGDFATNALTVNGTLTTTGNATLGGDLTFDSGVFNINNNEGAAIIQGGWSGTWGDFTAMNSSYAWEGAKEPGSVITSNNFPLVVTSGNTGTPFSNTYMTVSNTGEVKIPTLYTTTSANGRKYLFVDTAGKLCVSSKSDERFLNNDDIELLKEENIKLKSEIDNLKSEIEEIKKLLKK